MRNKAVMMWEFREQAEPDMEGDCERDLFFRAVIKANCPRLKETTKT